MSGFVRQLEIDDEWKQRLEEACAKVAEKNREANTKALREIQSAVHMLRKSIHARETHQALDLRCHDIWTEIERLVT